MVVLLGLDSQVSEAVTPSLRDEWLQRAMVEFLPHETLNRWGLGGRQRWMPFQGPRGVFRMGQLIPTYKSNYSWGLEREAAGWKEAGAG